MIALLLPILLTTTLPERTVIIGDSQAEGLKSTRVLTEMGVQIHAYGGRPSDFFVRWLERHPQAVVDRELVYFQLGGNDISMGRSAERIQANMRRLAEIVRAHNPDALVVFGTIPVRGQWFDALKRKHRPLVAEREATLERVNSWLAQGDHPELTSFPLNGVIADPEQPRLQRLEFKRRFADVHLNRRGYLAFAQALAGTWLGE